MYHQVSLSKILWMFFVGFTTILASTTMVVGKDKGEEVAQYQHVEWPADSAKAEITAANGIAIDSKGRIYAAAGIENPILVFSPDGALLDAWGKDLIKGKHIVRIYNDKVYVCDTTQHQIYEFTTDGKLLREFGTKGVAGTGPNEFNMPTDIVIAPNGDFYITDGYGNRRIVCLDSEGKFKFAWGEAGTGPSQFNNPHDIVIDKDNKLYVADRENNRIQIFDLEGNFIKQWQGVGQPYGLELIPGTKERLLVTDGNVNGPHRVLILDLEGNVLSSFGTKGAGPGQFDVPHSIAMDKEGNLYIAEVNNKRISKFVKQAK